MCPSRGANRPASGCAGLHRVKRPPDPVDIGVLVVAVVKHARQPHRIAGVIAFVKLLAAGKVLSLSEHPNVWAVEPTAVKAHAFGIVHKEVTTAHLISQIQVLASDVRRELRVSVGHRCAENAELVSASDVNAELASTSSTPHGSWIF